MTQSEAERELTELNIRIGTAETKGDAEARSFLCDTIAPVLAFRRANEKIDSGVQFLQAVKPSDQRETTIEKIDVYGNRAVVRCVVTMKSAAGEKRFHNIRLFVKHEGKWRLLGWANEAVG
jgi:hypothetical protein